MADPENEWVPIFVQWVNEGGNLDLQQYEIPPILQQMLEAYHYYPRGR